jgi:hypothetical protein
VGIRGVSINTHVLINAQHIEVYWLAPTRLIEYIVCRYVKTSRLYRLELERHLLRSTELCWQLTFLDLRYTQAVAMYILPLCARNVGAQTPPPGSTVRMSSWLIRFNAWPMSFQLTRSFE